MYFVVAMGNAPENYHNLRELFACSSIRKLFENDIPIQIGCDFKVAALLVGIQQASSNYPCPFCLWRNGSLCTGLPVKARKHQDLMVDLVRKCHNVINNPIISWSESPMEKIALAPLHIFLGLVNILYNEARPSDSASSRRDRQLYKHHCSALCRYRVHRSEYWNATLEGNSWVLGHLAISPKDISPKDILPKDISPKRHLAERHCAEKTSCRKDISPKDIVPKAIEYQIVIIIINN